MQFYFSNSFLLFSVRAPGSCPGACLRGVVCSPMFGFIILESFFHWGKLHSLESLLSGFIILESLLSICSFYLGACLRGVVCSPMYSFSYDHIGFIIRMFYHFTVILHFVSYYYIVVYDILSILVVFQICISYYIFIMYS